MTIDWATALAAIDGDNTSIAVVVRAKVTAVGQIYNRAGHPDVMSESAAHIAWRAAFASELAARDRTAASADGSPATTIDPANPGASRNTILTRLAAARASGAVGVLIADMQKSPPQAEPAQWVDAYYASAKTITSEFKVVGDIEVALLAALDELAAYVSFR